jgi:dihydroneopterin aldolase
MEKLTIQNLSVAMHIGVTEQEREKKQTLGISVDVEPVRMSADMDDTLDNTVDYSALRRQILELLDGRDVHLIETVAHTIAHHIKETFSVASVTVTVRKRPYDDVEYVSYSLSI